MRCSDLSGCGVAIYQGTNTAQPSTPVPTLMDYDISDLDVENFFCRPLVKNSHVTNLLAMYCACMHIILFVPEWAV